MSMGETDGNIMFSEGEVTPWSHSMILLFRCCFIYDFFYKSSLVKNVRVSTIISYAFVAGMIY